MWVVEYRGSRSVPAPLVRFPKYLRCLCFFVQHSIGDSLLSLLFPRFDNTHYNMRRGCNDCLLVVVSHWLLPHPLECDLWGLVWFPGCRPNEPIHNYGIVPNVVPCSWKGLYPQILRSNGFTLLKSSLMFFQLKNSYKSQHWLLLFSPSDQ
jgi:hypothetical protein